MQLYSHTPVFKGHHETVATCPHERESQCVLDMALSVSSANLNGVSGKSSLGAMPSW